ncbi:hypothetical protein PoB_005707400 [Plakobranchus ocellatus]|uniref:Uncharacterized protein n=1 Tax=Plakobranchus ocellatus TaxID=259542 RepID=A0AAV4CIC0_9GAST|nr:hypothetical protein PoB_005707400 [Plakobranchus ocellatus]
MVRALLNLAEAIQRNLKYIGNAGFSQKNNVKVLFGLCIASPQHADLWLSGRPSGQRAGSGARTRDSEVPVYLNAGALIILPPPPSI